jgi:dihydroorotase
MSELIKKLTSTPAGIFNLSSGNLSLGNDADILIFNPNFEYSIDISKFHSKSKNSPFDGWKVKGKVIRTLVRGKTVYPTIEN